MDRILDIVSRRLAHFLSAPIKGYRPIVNCDPQCLAKVLRPADILLVEGDSPISAAIRYLTQSTWSHAALYVGRIIDRHDRTAGRTFSLRRNSTKESSLRRYRNTGTRIAGFAVPGGWPVKI